MLCVLNYVPVRLGFPASADQVCVVRSSRVLLGPQSSCLMSGVVLGSEVDVVAPNPFGGMLRSLSKLQSVRACCNKSRVKLGPFEGLLMDLDASAAS